MSMIIIAGHELVDAERRDDFVSAFGDLVRRARDFDGCIHVAITADSVDPERVNVIEVWRDADALKRWRQQAKGPRVGKPKHVDVKQYDAAPAPSPKQPHADLTNDPKAVIDRFQEAFAQRVPDKLVDIIADDCVMEGVGPAPDGNRWTGYEECLAGWRELLLNPELRFENERVDVESDRAIILWRLQAAEPFRGVTLMRVRDGKIVEALGYGKRPEFVTP